MDDSTSSLFWRMDWGFGNPNKTATLIAFLMIASWAFPYFLRKGFWASLGLFTGFGMCLILTQSRGGLVSGLIGCLTVLIWTRRPYSKIHAFSVVLACLTLLVFSIFVRPEAHLTKGVISRDRSVENRLLIWEQVPAMIHSAPDGWGIGKSGDAYMQWFQPVTRGEGYRTLVNSHFTWLVELGWPGRILYLLAWATCFVLLWPSSEHRWFSIPLGIWVAFGLCSFFSSVAEAPALWIMPGGAVVMVLISRFKAYNWPSPRLWTAGVLAALLATGALLTWERLTPDSVIHSNGDNIVTLGAQQPGIWLVAPNDNILGEHYGHEIRRTFASNRYLQQEGVGIAPNLQHVPQNSALVFSGSMPTSFTNLRSCEIIFIDPSPVSAEVLKSLETVPHVTIIMGEYSRNREFWTDQINKSHIILKIVPGAEEYIGNFISLVVDIVRSS